MLVYHVVVQFKEEYLPSVDEFLLENFKRKEIICKKEDKVKLEISLDEDDGPGELENELYVLLDGWRLGNYIKYNEVFEN